MIRPTAASDVENRDGNAGSEKGRTAGCWVIGDDVFVKKVVADAEKRRLLVRHTREPELELTRIASLVCAAFDIKPDDLGRRQRDSPASDARKAFAYLCVRRHEIPLTAVARFFNVTVPAISGMLREGKDVAEKHQLLS